MHKFSVSKDMKIKITMIKGEGERLVGKVNRRVARTLRLVIVTPKFR